MVRSEPHPTASYLQSSERLMQSGWVERACRQTVGAVAQSGSVVFQVWAPQPREVSSQSQVQTASPPSSRSRTRGAISLLGRSEHRATRAIATSSVSMENWRGIQHHDTGPEGPSDHPKSSSRLTTGPMRAGRE